MTKSITIVLLLCAALVGAGIWILSHQERHHGTAKSPGSFVVSNHAGILPSSATPPREAEISESGGKVRVNLRMGQVSALGVNAQIHGGAEFDADPQWFVCFDDKDVLHYGIYPKWVARIEERGNSVATVSLSGTESTKVFAEVAKALKW